MKNTIIIILLAVIAFFAMRACVHAKKEIRTGEKIEKIKQDSTSYYYDLFKTEHAIREVAEANLATVQVKYKGLLDSIAEREKVKPKDVQAVTAAGTVAKATIIPEVQPLMAGDSLRGYSIEYGDRWTSIAGRVGDSSSLTYQVRDSIIFTTYSRRKGIFGKKETILDGYSLNPAVHLTGITGVRITPEKPKRFGIGPYLGYGWDGIRWAPTAGISVHYSLIKF